MADSGYAVGGSGAAPGQSVSPGDDSKDYWTLGKCKRAYLDYLGAKRLEIEEQQEARRYRHGSHWTAEQIKVLNARKQPVVTYNRIGRKIDGIVGLVEKMRQDPKAYPRTPKHEQGAELATAVLRYVLDEQEWKAKSPIVAENGAVDGIGGVEIELTKGDHGDNEISFDCVDVDGFFYDPRSFRLDFTDARFMGVGKWVDSDTAKEMFPDKAEEIAAAMESGTELSTNSDRDAKWFQANGDVKRLRLVDLWYRHNGEWCFTLLTGSMKLMEGKSFLVDEKNKTLCKFIMFSGSVDHDGDRYGFVRNLKSANDEINQRRSKGLFELNSRRIIGETGAFDDIETARREAARPDGVVLRNKGFEAEFDDNAKIANIEGAFKFLEDAKAEIENFAGNPALVETNANAKSGRAIALLQQGAIAELGPYILAYRGWKVRVYRAIWNAVQRHWSAERWIRVTDDDGIAQFIQVNGLGLDPHTGMPTIINALGSLDVDIILDEGPDQVNMMADAYDTLTVLASQGSEIPPQLLIELSPLASSVKKRATDILEKAQQAAQQQPNPEVQKAQAQIELDRQKAAAQIELKNAENQNDRLIEHQKAEQDAQLQERKIAADIALKREQTAAEIELARQKAAAELELKTHVARADAELKQQSAEADLSLAERKVQSEDARNAAATEQSREASGKSDGVMAAALSAVAHAIEKSSAPRTIRKGKDGSYRAEVG